RSYARPIFKLMHNSSGVILVENVKAPELEVQRLVDNFSGGTDLSVTPFRIIFKYKVTFP
ncbi:hypothetical protein, partial [Aquimarina muelleri]|uniref:hypothetical protein n=1 Tax=Aquimarina muelleri TaxID=279356 RepID=UPI001E60D9FD